MATTVVKAGTRQLVVGAESGIISRLENIGPRKNAKGEMDDVKFSYPDGFVVVDVTNTQLPPVVGRRYQDVQAISGQVDQAIADYNEDQKAKAKAAAAKSAA